MISSSHRDLYMTTHNTQSRETSIPSARSESTISARVRQHKYALDRPATGIGDEVLKKVNSDYINNNINTKSYVQLELYTAGNWALIYVLGTS